MLFAYFTCSLPEDDLEGTCLCAQRKLNVKRHALPLQDRTERHQSACIAKRSAAQARTNRVTVNAAPSNGFLHKTSGDNRIEFRKTGRKSLPVTVTSSRHSRRTGTLCGIGSEQSRNSTGVLFVLGVFGAPRRRPRGKVVWDGARCNFCIFVLYLEDVEYGFECLTPKASNSWSNCLWMKQSVVCTVITSMLCGLDRTSNPRQ